MTVVIISVRNIKSIATHFLAPQIRKSNVLLGSEISIRSSLSEPVVHVVYKFVVQDNLISCCYKSKGHNNVTNDVNHQTADVNERCLKVQCLIQTSALKSLS